MVKYLLLGWNLEDPGSNPSSAIETCRVILGQSLYEGQTGHYGSLPVATNAILKTNSAIQTNSVRL